MKRTISVTVFVALIILVLLALAALQERYEHERRIAACIESGTVDVDVCEIIVGVLEIDAGQR